MNETIVIIAGGPSLTTEDVQYCEQTEVHILGINDAYRICGKLKYLYACDRRWWFYHYSRVADYPCRKFSLENPGYPRIEIMENDGNDGLSFEWPKLRTGKNSGYQAINLAILLGYKRLVLLGYDMQHTGGRAHWFGDHPKPLQNSPLPRITDWIRRFNNMVKALPKDVTILNASRETALECFPRISLKKALNVSLVNSKYHPRLSRND